jgi:hypothetical protein
MVVKQWIYREHRIELALLGGSYRSSIYEPGNPEEISYTPVVEMKHGHRAAQIAAEKFVDDRLERKNPAP